MGGAGRTGKGGDSREHSTSHQHLPRKRLRGDGPRGPSRGSGACGHSQEVQLLQSPSQTEPQDLLTLTSVLVYTQKTELRRGEKKREKGVYRG